MKCSYSRSCPIRSTSPGRSLHTGRTMKDQAEKLSCGNAMKKWFLIESSTLLNYLIRDEMINPCKRKEGEN